MNRPLALSAALALAAVLGCRSVPRANVAPNTRVSVVLDRAVPASLAPDKASAQQQIGDWMERDLVNVLADAGYQSAAVARAADAPRGQDSYVLAVKILKYSPGSAAGRMFVGFGVGAASLDVHYELRTPQGKVLLAQDDGVGSGVAWQKIARRLNVNMTQAVSGVLAR